MAPLAVLCAVCSARRMLNLALIFKHICIVRMPIRICTCTGIIERTGDETLEITELPVKVWTQTYKAFLEGLILGAEDTKAKGMQTLQTYVAIYM